MLRVIRNHRRAAHAETAGYEALSVNPVPLDHANCRRRILPRTRKPCGTGRWRSANSTATATPRTTVGSRPPARSVLVMDCDTTGIEPDFALVKFKKLAGGGYFKIINRAVPDALRPPWIFRGADRRDRGLCGRPWLADAGGWHQPHHPCAPRALTMRRWKRLSAPCPPPSTSSSFSTNGRSARILRAYAENSR